VTRVPILLIESLDHAGAAPDDARLRVEALRAAGCVPRTLIVGTAVSTGGAEVIPAGAAPDAVRVALAGHPADLALIAAALPGGGAAARWLPPTQPARWWPTGLGATRRLTWGRPRELEPLGAQGRASRHDAAAIALDLALIDERQAGRRHLPLWDGDYVLVPASLGGAAGGALIAAFAALARRRDGLDLVVLSETRPQLQRRARRLGVGTRVHFVGAATREAEWAWLKGAAALIAGPGPIAAALALRALACGCPVLDTGGGPGDPLHAWLAACGAAPGPPGLAALARLVDRDPGVRAAIERGRHAAAAHTPRALATRLAAALAQSAATPRLAA